MYNPHLTLSYIKSADNLRQLLHVPVIIPKQTAKAWQHKAHLGVTQRELLKGMFGMLNANM